MWLTWMGLFAGASGRCSDLVEVTAILSVIQASGGDEKQAVRMAQWRQASSKSFRQRSFETGAEHISRSEQISQIHSMGNRVSITCDPFRWSCMWLLLLLACDVCRSASSAV